MLATCESRHRNQAFLSARREINNTMPVDFDHNRNV